MTEPTPTHGTLDGPAGSDAHVARELVGRTRLAMLSTLALRPAGFPFGSLVGMAADDDGRPLFMLSSLSEHTKNLDACDKASLLVTEQGVADLLGATRVTLLGACARVPEAELPDVHARYFARHPEAAGWLGDIIHTFGFYRLAPFEIRVVVGFGRMSWITFEEYMRALS